MLTFDSGFFQQELNPGEHVVTLRRRRGFLGIEALWLSKVVHVRFAISASRPWKMGGKREYVESIRKGLKANNRGEDDLAAIK